MGRNYNLERWQFECMAVNSEVISSKSRICLLHRFHNKVPRHVFNFRRYIPKSDIHQDVEIDFTSTDQFKAIVKDGVLQINGKCAGITKYFKQYLRTLKIICQRL